MDRRQLLASTGSLALVGSAGCLDRVIGGGEAYDIGMSANAFQPVEFETRVGETVIWKNDGSRAHTVTAYDDRIPDDADFFATGDFDNQGEAFEAWHEDTGGNLYTGERFEYTFEIPGTYEYYCIPHERHGMTGSVIVAEN